MADAYLCRNCGHRWPDAYSVWRCECGAALWWASPELPAVDERVTLGEGTTRLIQGSWNGRQVWYADEGGQPTGSFKDRGVALIVSHALSKGIRALGEDSSGNAGASFAAYCARADIDLHLFVPASTSPGKLGQAHALASRVHLITGDREAVAAAAQASSDGRYAGHNWHPLFIAGVATLAADLVAQGCVPGRVIVPVGNGSLICGLASGFAALRAAGTIETIPQLVGVQSKASNAIYRRFHGLGGTHEAEGTIAEGIAIRATTRDGAVADAMRASGGDCLQVGDEEVLAALRQALAQGLFIEPTSAVALAGLTQLQQRAASDDGLGTAVVLTGTGLKAAAQIEALIT